jgi:hypothetical protein
MRRISSSTVALGMSAAALFIALGGSAVALTQIGTSQIKNGAVTSPKLAKGAVTNPKLATGAVTGSKVAAHSLTANDIAPHTYLRADATAANANRLGGLLPADFVQGVGVMDYRRLVVPANSGSDFLDTLFGEFTVSCGATGTPTVTWTPTIADAEYAAAITTTSAARLVTLNAIPAGVGDTEPATAGPFSITYQIGYTAGLDHMVTAVITGRYESGTGCVFTGQELTSG